eukprot:3422816-Pyramimonas_sp.AAC.1
MRAWLVLQDCQRVSLVSACRACSTEVVALARVFYIRGCLHGGSTVGGGGLPCCMAFAVACSMLVLSLSV